MARMKDYEHPFFRPLWRRVAIVAACLVWSGLEYFGGSPTWSLIALAFAAYGGWQFFYLYKPAEDGSPPADGEPKE